MRQCRLTGKSFEKFLWGLCQLQGIFAGHDEPPNPPDVMCPRFATARPQSTKRMVAHMTCNCKENLRLKSGVKRWSTFQEQNQSRCRLCSSNRPAVPEYHF